MFRRLFFAVCLTMLLTGCALPGTVAAPTPYPADYIPTVIYLTAQSINATMSAGVTPTETITPSPSPVPSTPVPTSTPTAASGIPLAVIQINSPGPMSRIVSRVEVHAQVQVDDGDRVETALYDETGQVISHPALLMFDAPGVFPVSVKMPFEIRAAGETGIVQMSIKDPHGRVIFLTSVRVLLLSDGVSQVNPAGNTIYERAVFDQLPVDTQVSGGTLSVKGRFAPVNLQPVILELIADNGKTLGLRVLNAAASEWQDFDTTIPYKVTQATPARLYIHQDDTVTEGRAYVYSQPLTLNP
jgi:hypothetical protein